MLKIQTFGGWGGTKGLSIMAGLTNVYNKGRFIVLNIRIYQGCCLSGSAPDKGFKRFESRPSLIFFHIVVYTVLSLSLCCDGHSGE